MATRSKAKAAVAAAISKQPVQREATKDGKPESVSTRVSEERSVNGKNKSAKPAVKRGKGKNAVTPVKEQLCTCSQGDDGTPMILCGQCKIWYHFSCVDLSETDAEDICFYVCPTCSTTTGLRTTKSWEGSAAFEEPLAKVQVPSSASTKARPTKQPKLAAPKKPAFDESEEEVSSEDDFVMDEDEKVKGSRSKRRRAAVPSETDTDTSDSTSHAKRKRRLRKISTSSPAPSRSNEIKRKASTSEGRSPIKRSKSGSHSIQDDPTRKYCLGKLEEVFRTIFFRYPHVQDPVTSGIVSKQEAEMTDEEKEALVQESKEFALGLEQAIFDIHADHDKKGNPIAGINYKDRYRTLEFNLSKPDRVVIHQRITSRNISPKDLSLMSSTDLANEETKQIIKIAEQEALEHSILPKTMAPRAKITHKGIEDIEIEAEAPSTSVQSYDVQREREVEAEERRERERMARLRGVERQRTASMSIPPESPTVSQNLASNSWGAPPPVPHYAQSPVEAMEPSKLPAFLAARRGSVQSEPEMNLADLINIDEQVTPSSDAVPTPPATSADHFIQVDPFAQPTIADSTNPTSVINSATSAGASPFSSHSQEKPAFSLSTLWSATASQKEGNAGNDDGEAPMVLSPAPLSPPTLKEEDHDMLAENVGPVEGNEPDFDMLFEDQAPAESTSHTPVSIESLAQVWQGKLSMPLDSSVPQETPMSARQVAGTTIDKDSLLWKTLFPSDHLRIDGRVPVPSSANYLTQMRLNPAKELYAVVFTPTTEQDESSFQALSDFLLSKDRHGLIFPWGSRPKEHHPGKELYVIPLKADDPIPEYMDLLDNLIIPKQRRRNYLVGIWVLNRGKLAPPVPSPPSHAHSVTPSIVAPSAIPPIVPTPPVAVTPTHPSTATPPQPPSSRGSLTPLQPLPTPVSSIIPAYTPLPTGVDPAALAAEVASLTPEQINLIRTLQLARASLPPPGPAQAAPPPPPIPQAYSPYPPQQPWQGSSSPYSAPHYPPSYGETWQSNHGSPPRGPPNHGERYNRGPPPGGDHDQRGGFRGKSRGRGGYVNDRNQPREGFNRPPVDSGWPRKQNPSDQGRRW